MVAAATIFIWATAARAQTQTANHRLGAPPLHPYSRGPDVAALQWLLSGHKPYALSKVKPTLSDYTRGISGPPNSRTWTAVKKLKFRIGFPGKGQCTDKAVSVHGVYWNVPQAGPYFFAILLGHKHVPSCWVALASKRLAEAARIQAAAPTSLALRISDIEGAEIRRGVYESWGANWGPRIKVYQAVTGAYRAAWCVSFAQWAFLTAGAGTFANRSAGVDYTIGWARYHGYLNAKAKPGALVAWYGDRSHMGFVWAVHPWGFDTKEGNTSNTAAIRHYTWASSRLHFFIWKPNVVHA